MRCQKVLRSSPAGRMTTSPEGEVMHLPGASLVSHNKRQEHHGSAQTARPRFLPPCLRKTKTQRSASGCTSGSPCCADMNPGGPGGGGSAPTVQHRQVLPSASLGRLMSRHSPKDSPASHHTVLADPPGGARSLSETLNATCFKRSAWRRSKDVNLPPQQRHF